MTTHKIINANSNDLSCIPNESINLIITSPPYPMIEMWDNIFCKEDYSIEYDLKEGKGGSAFNKMHTILNQVWKECDRVLTKGGFICINIGDATRTLNNNFQLYSNHTKIINFFLNLGYNVLPDIHWSKPTNSPNKFMGSGMYPAGAYVTYEHEYILIFRKGNKRSFSIKEKELRQQSAYFWEERNEWFSDIWKITGTNQTIKNICNTRNRNGSYPFEIPFRLINMYSIKEDTILDPFMGLGTTNLACMVCNRNSIGVEIDTSLTNFVINHLSSQTPKQLNKIIDARISKHELFINNLPIEKFENCYKNEYYNFKVKTKQEIKLRFNYIQNINYNKNIITCDYI